MVNLKIIYYEKIKTSNFNLDIINEADWIIDIGTGAGKFGGEIMLEGTVEELLKNKKYFTAKYTRQHLEL